MLFYFNILISTIDLRRSILNLLLSNSTFSLRHSPFYRYRQPAFSYSVFSLKVFASLQRYFQSFRASMTPSCLISQFFCQRSTVLLARASKYIDDPSLYLAEAPALTMERIYLLHMLLSLILAPSLAMPKLRLTHAEDGPRLLRVRALPPLAMLKPMNPTTSTARMGSNRWWLKPAWLGGSDGFCFCTYLLNITDTALNFTPVKFILLHVHNNIAGFTLLCVVGFTQTS